MARERSVILAVGARLLAPTAVVTGVYLLFAGHNQPGGGFVGGLVMAAGIVLQVAARGEPLPISATPWPYRLLGAGLLLAVATAVGSLVAGGELLESTAFEATVPLLGTIKTTTSLAFDIGVHTVVVALVLVVLSTLDTEDAPT